MQKNGKGVATVTVGEASNNPLSAKHHPDKKKTGVENMETETMNRMSTDQSKSHLEEHKYKYGGVGVVALALGLGLGLGLAAAAYYYSSYETSDQENQVAAQQGSSLQQVSVIPPKGDDVSSRRLRRLFSSDPFSIHSIQEGIKAAEAQLLATGVTPVYELSELSDYNIQPPANYVVRDPSAEVVEQVNMISCYISQLKISAVGLNLELNSTSGDYVNPNPDKKPYTAMVDPAMCGEEGDKFTWSISATGPTSGGAGDYAADIQALIKESDYSYTVNMRLENTIGDCDETGCLLLTSRLSFYLADYLTISAVYIDNRNSENSIVQFIQSTDWEGSCLPDGMSVDTMLDDYFFPDFDDDWWYSDDYGWTGDDDMFNWDEWDDDYEWDDDWWQVDDEWWNGDDMWFFEDDDYDWNWDDDFFNDVDMLNRRRSKQKVASSSSAAAVAGGKEKDAAKKPSSLQQRKHALLKALGHLKKTAHRKSASHKAVRGFKSFTAVKPRNLHRKAAKSPNSFRDKRRKNVMKTNQKYVDFLKNAKAVKAAKSESRKNFFEKSKATHEEKRTKILSGLKKLSLSPKKNDKNYSSKNQGKMQRQLKQRKQKKSNLRSEHMNKKSALKDVDDFYAHYNNDLYKTYLAVNVDRTTMTGQALTQVAGESSYRLLFSESAILRSENQEVATCIDYTTENRLLVPNAYNLYNANDGSSVLFERGFTIQKEVDGVLYEGWVDNWGAWAYWTYDYNSGEWNDDNSWIQDGALVTKIDYSSSDNQQYTLKIVDARLYQIKSFSLTLGEVKDLNLIVQSYSSDEAVYQVHFDGEKLVRGVEYKTMCVVEDWNVYVEADDGYWYSGYETLDVNSDQDITWDTCYCLDLENPVVGEDGTSYNVRPSGSFTYYTNDGEYVSSRDAAVKLTDPQEFIPTTTEFPYLEYEGLMVSTESYSMWGKIEVEYESIQTIYGVNMGTYTKGDKLYQTSTGAKGTVIESTGIYLRGYSCDDCITYVYNSYSWTCEAEDDMTYSDSYIVPGLKLRQAEKDENGDAVVDTNGDPVYITGFVGGEWGVNLDWEALPVIMTDDTKNFDVNTDLEVMFPSHARGDLVYYKDAFGFLTASTTDDATLSTMWEDLSYSGVTICTNDASGEEFGGEVPVVVSNGGTGAAITFYGYSNADWQYGYVSSEGTGGCDDQVTVTTSAPTGYTCTSLPTITIKCSVGSSNEATTVKVLLPKGSNVPKFEYVWDWSDPDAAVMMTTPGDGGDVSIGFPWSVYMDIGDLFPITADTKLSYRIERTVNPGTTVPNLLCYSDCPDASTNEESSDLNMKMCEGESCFYELPTRLSKYIYVVDEGKCQTTSADVPDSSDLPTISFTGIGGSPNIDATWYTEEAGAGSYNLKVNVALSDPGMVCDSSVPPTAVFSDVVLCSEGVPILEVQCTDENDWIDFRQARPYTFDSLTGIMTDTTSGNSALIADNDNYHDEWDQVYFGPFFPDSDDKLNLACDWDSDLVCPYKIDVLEEYYYYYSGPGAQRVSLVNSDGDSVYFRSSIQLLYTHQGDFSNSGISYDGSTSFLEYYGPQQLYGFPTFCLNPESGQNSDVCYPPGSSESTINGNDIGVADGALLKDSFGNNYYAKPSVMQEIYPATSNRQICEGMSMSDFAVEVPTVDEVYKEFPGKCASYPTFDELSTYLNAGEPSVISGMTIAMLQTAAKASATDV